MKRIIKRLLLTPNTDASKVLLDAHISRINADGGTFNMSVYDQSLNYVSRLMGLYGTDLTNVPIAIDPHYFGYKIGTGSGVTANGNAAGKLYNLTGVSGDFVQGTPGNQPLLLKHTGENYWWNGGVISNYCSTPSATANQITGDIDIRARASFNSLSSQLCLVAKYNGISNENSYIFRQNSSGGLTLLYSINGTNILSASSSVAHPFSVNQVGWFRFTRVASTGVITFYTSTDGTNWAQLGVSLNGTTGNLYNANQILEIGSRNTGGNDIFSGTIYRAQIYNGINGTLAVDFNPSSYNAATSTTQWTSATGETWTINTGTASSGYKGVLVDRTIVQSDGVDDYLNSSNLTLNSQQIGIYSTARVLNNITTGNLFLELSSNYNNNNNSFYILNSNGTGTARRFSLSTNSVATYNSSTTNADVFNFKLQILSGEIDTSLSASNENKTYVNGTITTATINPSNDQTTSFNVAYPLYLFARGTPSLFSNMSLTSLIITKDVTKRTDVELIIRNMNNNFAF